MKIRLGDFGGRVAPTTPTERRTSTEAAFVTPRTPESGLGGAAMNAAATLLRQERAEEERANREAEAQRRQDELQGQRNRAAAGFAQYRVDVDTLATDIGVRLTEGQVKREDARKELDTGLAELKKKHLEPLDQGSKAALADNLILFDGHANAKFDGALRELAKKERIDGFQNLVESLQREALIDRQSAVQKATAAFQGEGAALMGADKAGKALQKFKEGVAFTDLDRRITQSQSSWKGLNTLKAELGSDAYADLDPERRNFLEAKIQRNQQHIVQMGEVAERRRLQALDMQSKRLAWYVENGREIPAAEFASFSKASKGTPYEGVADMITGEQKAVAELTGKTPADMVKRVKEVEAGYGATPTKEQIIHVEKLKRFTERSIKLLNESPLTYAVEREGAKLEPLDFTQPAGWNQNLAARAAVLTEQAKRTGAAPKGLFPQEVAQLSSFLKAAKVEERREVLAALSRGFGNDQVFKATMQQIAPDDPVTASAGLAAARGQESMKDRFLADEMLRGQSLLAPNRKEDGKPGGGKVLPMPEDKALMQVFASRAKNAFGDNTEAGSIFFQTAKAIYAARTDRAGDMSGVIDGSRWEDSIKAATGGGFHDYGGGRKIVLPYGMGAGDFKDEVKRRSEWLIENGNLEQGWTVAKLAALPLQNAGDGRYIFRIGDAKLKDKAGRDVVLDFNVSAPFRSSGTKAAGAPKGERRDPLDTRWMAEERGAPQ